MSTAPPRGAIPVDCRTKAGRRQQAGRVSAADVVLLLHQEADRTGDERYRVTGTTLRSWVHRGHITRDRGGYSPREVLAYLETRR